MKQIAIIFATSCLVGVILSYVPWGDPKGIHGQGFPFPTVFWDRSSITGRFVDFVSPWGLALNPLAVTVLGLGSYGIIRMTFRRYSVRNHIGK
jgi:hypothetical protein